MWATPTWSTSVSYTHLDVYKRQAHRKVGADGTLSQFVPTRRVRLYNYLQHVGQPTADEVETRVIGAVSIDAQKCSSCRMCAVFCPTGAIKKLDEGGVFGICLLYTSYPSSRLL